MDKSSHRSYEIEACGTVLIGDTIEIGVLNIQETFSPHEILDDEAAHFAELGLQYLDKDDYELARIALEKSLERSLAEPELQYYTALAQLAGRRPKRLNKAEAKAIESRLRQAIRGKPAPHARLLYAFFKHDFYILNGLRLDPPFPNELLAAVVASGIPQPRWEELHRHTPIEDFARENSIRP